MKKTSKEKREIIFKAYSDNLELLIKNGFIAEVRKTSNPTFICPICLNEFFESDLNIKLDNFLTLEDAPPKALGGKSRVLTCKKCNNTCGGEIDQHLIKRIKELDKSKFLLILLLVLNANMRG